MPRRGLDSCLRVVDRLRAQGVNASTTFTMQTLRYQIALVCGMQDKTIKHYVDMIMRYNIVVKEGDAFRINYNEVNKLYGI